MILTETATATTIDDSAPATFTCAQCPFSRQIEDNRYCCSVSQTASDVKRGHWTATVSCFEALAKAEAEVEKAAVPDVAEVETPIAHTDATEEYPIATETIAPAATKTETATPVAIGTNDEQPPNRGDNGRGRVQPVPVKKVSTVPISGNNRLEPVSAKKLMLSLVSVKRITSDVPAHNFDENELEIAGELSLAIGGFIIPPVVVRDSSGYKIVSGHFQFHASVLARRLNLAGRREHSGLDSGIRKSSDSFGATSDTKTQSCLDTTAPSTLGGRIFTPMPS
ncbi:hypothetical protein QUA62_27000 [Microcoleus sp. MON1_C1]|uniref:hypothetical protein n=1 Tax=Microcoleus sp. MON1_C1 TaxID=2818827 RepID=UPI002FD661A3